MLWTRKRLWSRQEPTYRPEPMVSGFSMSEDDACTSGESVRSSATFTGGPGLPAPGYCPRIVSLIPRIGDRCSCSLSYHGHSGSLRRVMREPQ